VGHYVAGFTAGSATLVRGSSPTDHDYDGEPLRSTREYQSDQPSPKAVHFILRQRHNALLDAVVPYQRSVPEKE
jgi:hypothetical protein